MDRSSTIVGAQNALGKSQLTNRQCHKGFSAPVVKLHCNHFRDAQELFGALETVCGKGNYNIQLRYDVYVVRIHNYNPPEDKLGPIAALSD
jgi:hypothetical protein